MRRESQRYQKGARTTSLWQCQTDLNVVVPIMTLLILGCLIPAIVMAFKLDEYTLADPSGWTMRVKTKTHGVFNNSTPGYPHASCASSRFSVRALSTAAPAAVLSKIAQRRRSACCWSVSADASAWSAASE